MFFIKDKFYREFKKLLSQKNFQITRKIEEDVYEITSGTVTFTVDVRDARRDFEYGRNSKTLEFLISTIELDFTSKYKLVSFNNAQPCLRVLLMDFLGDIKKVVAFSTDNNTVYPLNSEYLKKWGIPKDVLFNVGDKNMCDVLREGSISVSTIAGQIRVIEFNSVNEKLRASVLSCSSFRKVVSEKLGPKFLVVIPSSESILAVEDVRNDIIETFGPIVMQEFQKSRNKLSTDVYLFTSTGISVAGKFSVPYAVQGV